jgi:hypothetical protein
MDLISTAAGDATMRRIIPLSSLGLTLALSGAALATPVDPWERPVDRHAFLERRGYANEPLLDYYRHKRYYRHDQDRARDKASGKIRLPRRRDPDGGGPLRPEAPEPGVRGRRLFGIAA